MQSLIRQIYKPFFHSTPPVSESPNLATQRNFPKPPLRHFLLGVLGLFVLWGCSDETPPAESNPPQTGTTPAATLVTPQQPANAETDPEQAYSTKKKSPKPISGIPLDVWPEVWFEDPLSVAENTEQTSAKAQQVVTDVASSTTEKQTTTRPTAAPRESADRPKWQTLLSGDEIQLETKDVRLMLKQAFQSVQRYNGHYKDISVDASLLAVLAMAADGHPDQIVWKTKALSVRDLAAEMRVAASGLGRKHYDPASRVYEQIEQLLSGNSPGKLKPPATEAALDELAPRGELMKRMQRSHDRIEANITDEKSFREAAEQLRHESLLVALLATVTSTEAYDMSDEPEYATQAQALIAAGLDAAQAVEQSDFVKFTTAQERMTKACTACHLDFRFDQE